MTTQTTLILRDTSRGEGFSISVSGATYALALKAMYERLVDLNDAPDCAAHVRVGYVEFEGRLISAETDPVGFWGQLAERMLTDHQDFWSAEQWAEIDAEAAANA